MMLRKTIRYGVLLLAVSLFSLSCGRDDPSVNATRLRIKLTDAASLVIREMHIDLQRIEVAVSDSDGGVGEWIPLEYDGGEYNILPLMNGKTIQLLDQYFPAGGKLMKIRLILGNNNRIMTSTNQMIPLQIAAEMMEGVVIEDVNASLSANIITSIMIDINAALSVREVNGNYFLAPAARAFPETFGGSLRGYVAPAEADAFVALVRGSDTLLTLPEASDGMFYFNGLHEGEWEVHLIADPQSGYRDTLFTETIVEGQSTVITPKPIQLKRLQP